MNGWIVMNWRLNGHWMRLNWLMTRAVIAIHQNIGDNDGARNVNILRLALRQPEMKIAYESSIDVDFVERIIDDDHHFERLIRLNHEVTAFFLAPDLIFQMIAYDCILTRTNADVKCDVTSC